MARPCKYGLAALSNAEHQKLWRQRHPEKNKENKKGRRERAKRAAIARKEEAMNG